MTPDPAHALRAALARIPEVASQEDLSPPARRSVYVPRLHAKALSPDASIVSGMRGSGKSWWTAVLADDATRGFAAELSRDPQLQRIIGKVGFGLDESNAAFPNRDAIAAMLAAGVQAVDVWWAVVLRHAVAVAHVDAPWLTGTWAEVAARVAAEPIRRDAVLTECDAAILAQGKVLVVLLDALDRLSTEWDRVRELTRAALEVCLRLRSRRALRLKLFLRPDLEEDERIWGFPDSSKLRQGRVSLDWPVADLYGLLWTWLANDPDVGEPVQWLLDGVFGAKTRFVDGIVAVPSLNGDEVLERLTRLIASPFMGRTAKRGLTFRWVPLHLADAAGRVSPRSWLLAFRRAAEETERSFPDFDRPLHYEAIQTGVVAASLIRVDEIAEDHPWVRPLLEAARGLTVPCASTELTALWTPPVLPGKTSPKLPPRRYSSDPFRASDPEALIDDLAALAVLYRTENGRINVPDIFRVGFGIKRRGGVRPPR